MARVYEAAGDGRLVAFIRVIDEDEAEGALFDVYDEVQRTRGRVSNVLRIQSLDPKVLKTHLDLYMHLAYGKGPLGRRQRELVAVVVSAANGCTYCVVHHQEALAKHIKGSKVVAQVAKDHTKAGLEPADRALCDFAVGLTREPGKGRREAVDALRKAGFDDEAILHATELTAYYNFVNRIVHGLGVELEADGQRDFHY